MTAADAHQPPSEGTPETPAAQVLRPEHIVNRNGRAFVLYAGLLGLAHDRGLKGISTSIVQIPSELNGMTAIVHAVVLLEGEDEVTREFMGLGDANPTNVSRMMVPHLIRLAETRAKARALRDAVNVGMTSFEELGDDTAHDGAQDAHKEPAWGSSATPRPVGQKPASTPPPAQSSEAAAPDPNSPASKQQLDAIAVLARAAGVEGPKHPLTFGQAANQILNLQRIAAKRETPGAKA
jgi:hypothetical protein